MANRRMVSQDIINTDVFLTMPTSSQALYFHLIMRADDDGFVQPITVLRSVGSQEDDLKILLAKRYILSFESGVVVVKHWLIHNLIRADMYKETTYLKEKQTLGLNEYGAYTELRDGVSEINKIEAPAWLKKRRKTKPESVCTDIGTQSVHRLGKVRLGKVSEPAPAKAVAKAAPKPAKKKKPIDPDKYAEGYEVDPIHVAEIIKAFETVDPKNKQYYGNTSQRKAAAFLIGEYTLEQVLKRIEFLPKSNKMPYFPNITTACQLRDNWVRLGDAVERYRAQHAEKNKKAKVAF